MIKILIVDDEKAWRDYHTEQVLKLFKGDISVEWADSASQAMNLVLSDYFEPFDIILTDMQMESNYTPLTAGEWFVKQLKNLEKYNDTKIIMISASGNIDAVAKSLNIDYIRKATAYNAPESYEILKY